MSTDTTTTVASYVPTTNKTKDPLTVQSISTEDEEGKFMILHGYVVGSMLLCCGTCFWFGYNFWKKENQVGLSVTFFTFGLIVFGAMIWRIIDDIHICLRHRQQKLQQTTECDNLYLHSNIKRWTKYFFSSLNTIMNKPSGREHQHFVV